MRLLMSGYVRVEYGEFEATGRIEKHAAPIVLSLPPICNRRRISLALQPRQPVIQFLRVTPSPQLRNEQNLCAGVLFGTEMAYHVSTIVAYIVTSLPGIAQLSPSDQPAPPSAGLFFGVAYRGRPAKTGHASARTLYLLSLKRRFPVRHHRAVLHPGEYPRTG